VCGRGRALARDFSVNATTHTAQRTGNDSAFSFPNGRYVISGLAAQTDTLAQVDWKYNVDQGTIDAGLVLRYVDANNHALVYFHTPSGLLRFRKVLAGVATELATQVKFFDLFPLNAAWSLRVVVNAKGMMYVWAFPAGSAGVLRAVLQDPVLATGGTLASGKVGMWEYYNSSPITNPVRDFDNFLVATPTTDAAVFANQSLELRHDRAIREDSTGTYWTPISKVEGKFLRIPPSGREGRTVRIIVKASRGDPRNGGADTGIDDISARLTVTPRILSVPYP
jgi:hypothetical protein